jgi:putative transposase
MCAVNTGYPKRPTTNWKSKYGGMMVSDVKKLKELEDENRSLKRMYADLSLQNEALRMSLKKSSKARRKT